MFRKLRLKLLLMAGLMSFGVSGAANATLIGDEVTVAFVVDGVLVEGGGPFTEIVGNGADPEFNFGDETFVDVGASSILYTSDAVIFGGFELVLTDLDWTGESGEIVGVELTLAPNITGDASFTADSVTLSIIGGFLEGGIGVNKFLASIDIITEHAVVPEPASLALFAAGLIGFGFARRRKQAEK